MKKDELWLALLQRLHKWARAVIFCYNKKCKHEPKGYARVESGLLREPGEQEREVKIRMCYIRCTKCKRLLKVAPAGIIYDPKYPEG